MAAMDEIRHLIVLMLENQSFDRLLGYLTLDDPTQKLAGLTGEEQNPVSPPGDMTPVPVQRVSSPRVCVTDPGPGHEFDARVMVLDGAITLVFGKDRVTYGPGDSCSVPAGTMHEEHTDADGVRYVSGRRSAPHEAADQ